MNNKLREIVLNYAKKVDNVISSSDFDGLVKAIESKFDLKEKEPKEMYMVRDDYHCTTYGTYSTLKGAKESKPKFPIHTIYHCVEVME